MIEVVLKLRESAKHKLIAGAYGWSGSRVVNYATNSEEPKEPFRLHA